ncbi:MAG: hypothetical protein QM715_18655 [Nibricoccus sp.]
MDTITKTRILVGKQFGISEADAITPANLSPEDRTRLFDYTFAYVAQHPEQYEPRQVEIAKRHVAAWGTNTPLLDTSFDWGLLAREVGENVLKAGEAVASVGQGVLNTFKLGSWLIPVAAVVLVGIYLWKAFKK